MSSRPREEIPPEADEVLPYLYVGNLVFARNPSLVAKLGITHILNLTRHSVPKELYEQCHYTAIVLKDKSGQDIISHFGTAFEVIESARRARGKIFVHCKAGVSRSVTITVAYLMHAYKWTLRESWFHVRKARSVIHPNRGFLHQLVQFEKTLFPALKGSHHLPSLNLREEIHFTVFERMEELYGAPLMDFCKANPECQHEAEELAAKAFQAFHSKANSSFCYDAGIAGKMHLHRVQLYTRADLPWLDACIQSFIAQLQTRQTQLPQLQEKEKDKEKEHRSKHHHHHHHHHSSSSSKDSSKGESTGSHRSSSSTSSSSASAPPASSSPHKHHSHEHTPHDKDQQRQHQTQPQQHSQQHSQQHPQQQLQQHPQQPQHHKHSPNHHSHRHRKSDAEQAQQPQQTTHHDQHQHHQQHHQHHHQQHQHQNQQQHHQQPQHQHHSHQESQTHERHRQEPDKQAVQQQQFQEIPVIPVIPPDSPLSPH